MYLSSAFPSVILDDLKFYVDPSLRAQNVFTVLIFTICRFNIHNSSEQRIANVNIKFLLIHFQNMTIVFANVSCFVFVMFLKSY